MKDKKIEQRMYSVDLEARADESEGIIKGRPIVFNQRTDIGGWFEEVIEPGALDKTDLRDVRLCLNHDTSFVYARSRRNNPNSTMRLMPNAEGMDFEANLAIKESARAKDLYTAVERKDIDKMSFMFVIGDEEWENLDSDYPTRHIKSIATVYEISICPFPAYEGTSVEIGARAKEALDNAKLELENARANASRSVETEGTENELELAKAKFNFRSKL